MSEKYFNADTNRAMLQEYLDICKKQCTSLKTKIKDNNRAEEIRQHIAFEVISQFADLHGKET